MGAESVSLETLVAQADYLTLHCPMMEKTRGIIGENEFKAMKKSAMLINCARGGLVDEAALYEALTSGEIAAAALDVFEQEPPKESPLFALDNMNFTPHLGASTQEAQVAVSVEIARQAVTFLKTGEAINALNLPRLSAEELKKSQQFMNLANILGKVLVGLADQPIERLEVSLFGKATELTIRPISVETLVGIFSGQLSTPVNRVNAENIAKRQGVSLVETKSDESPSYLSLLKVVGHYGDQQVSLEGTLLGGCHPRLVSINEFEVEVVPKGILLVTHHDDKPGVIAAIGSVLGAANINITRMEVGMGTGSTQAMALISISTPLNDELFATLRAIPAVHNARQICL
jgi:D-3-phosphoglycerate dehydrogenase